MTNFAPLSVRAMLLQLQTNYRMLNLIQVYAPPTADKDENELESFYGQIETLLQMTKRGEITMVMDDCNAKVGNEQFENMDLVIRMNEEKDFCNSAVNKKCSLRIPFSAFQKEEYLYMEVTIRRY